VRRGLAVAALLAAALTHSVAAQSTTPPRPASGYAVVLASALNIRERPALDAPVVAVATRGEQLCVLRVEEDWAEVVARAPAGGTLGAARRARGYVSRGFIANRSATPEELLRMGCTDASGG
jgi:hypothetical protein